MFQWLMMGAATMVWTSVAVAADQPADTQAPAAKSAEPRKIIWQKMDPNQDGKVTADEQKAGIKKWFKELDANNDGKLTTDEFSGARFAKMDIDKDGSVTLEEYLVYFVGQDAATGSQTVASDKRDANDDGIITPLEVIAYRKSVFKAMDANGDGKVSPDDMKAYDASRFSKMDADRDGVLTVDEMVAVIAVPAATPKTDTKTAGQPAK